MICRADRLVRVEADARELNDVRELNEEARLEPQSCTRKAA
jgi:hypothetical protein